MQTKHPGEIELEIIGAAKRLLHERFPDLHGWPDWPDVPDEERDALLSSWNASGDAYVGAYFDRGARYFAVVLETRTIDRDGKYAARVCKTALGGEDGAGDIDEEILTCDDIHGLVRGISRSLSAWRQPYLIHVSEDCTYFEALSFGDRRLLASEGVTVSNVVAEVMAEGEAHALETFRRQGPRTRAFHDMVDRGIAYVSPPAGTPSP